MKLNKKDCDNLIDTLVEWKECVGCKEMDNSDAGLDDDRYEDLMKRLTEHAYSPEVSIVRQELRKRAAERRKALPAHADKFIWVLDAANGNVLKVEIPIHFPENGDYEDYLEANLPKDIRLSDCNWLVAGAGVQTVVRERYHLGF